MSYLGLLLSLSLVMVALLISAYQKLGLEREILIGTVRAAVQLTAIGFVLSYVFKVNDLRLTLGILCLMIVIAGQNAAKRGEGIPGVFWIVTCSIGGGTLVTLLIMTGLGIISLSPSQVIPIGGMIIGNSMVGSGLVLNRLIGEIKQNKTQLEAALALGASARQAADPCIRAAIKAGLIPTVDSMKTLGIVQLPGMMTGLILAGANPLQAVKYQILVAFMLTSTVSISGVLVGLLAYRKFFTLAHQLKI